MPSNVVARLRRATLAVKIESTYGTDPWAGAPPANGSVP
jgi:hypothetical protein